MTIGFVVRRRLEAIGSIPEQYQWIEAPGYLTVHYGRRVPRLSSYPRLTKDPARAYVFSSRPAAQLQIDRYFSWIKNEFEVVKP